MRKSHTFWKLFLGNLLVVVVVVAVVGVLAYRRLDENYQRRTQEDQDRLAHIVAGHFQDLWPLEGGRIDRMCKSMLRETAVGSPPAPAREPPAASLPAGGGPAEHESADAALAGRLTVVAVDGTVLGDSDADPAHMVNHRTPDRPEVVQALSGRDGEDVRYSETIGMKYRYVAVPVTYGGRTVAAVRLAVPVGTIAAGEAFFRDALIASALGAVAVAAILGVLASWIWAAPLGRASLVARQIAAGDFSKGLRVEGAGELADLARAMNEMRDSLVGQIRITQAQRQNLQTVLASLREGLVAVRADGTVALVNRAAADLLAVKPQEAVGKRLEAVLPSLDLYNLYQDAVGPQPPGRAAGQDRPVGAFQEDSAGGQQDQPVGTAQQDRPAGAAGQGPGSHDAGHSQVAVATGAPHAGRAEERGPVSVELDRGGARRILEVQAARASSEASDIGGILVLRDVTELANAAAMKSQFVANASHELRTPLATVRAAVDALSDVDLSGQEDLKRCVDILDRHVGRLEALTGDLLDLHMVESGKLPLRTGELRLGELASGVQAEFAPRAEEKGLHFTATARPADHAFRADRSLVELILRNLLDNAIKFTPSGGSVECSLEEGPAGGALLRVRDTGVGISRQDQTRVFERFFQVDAARTGDAGPRPDGRPSGRGTGLGLAIVKHAAERLGAKVELHSALGTGTTITLVLPAAPQ